MDYLSFFSLNDDPFRITPDISYFYNSPEHSTALLSLEYCMKEKEGFCILTGEPGTGKTTILRVFVEKWKDEAEFALIITPRLSPEEFFMAILEDFKIPVNSSSKNDMLKGFRDFLLRHANNNKRVAIIVDEAQELPDTTLEELRLLSNLETEKDKLLQIILIGQPELRNKLQGKALRQLNSRITVRIQLKPLSISETYDYINNRLTRAGNRSLLFKEKAKEMIFELSGGIPRTINLLASRGLMAAFLEKSKVVFDRHIEQGASDVLDENAATEFEEKPPLLTRRTIIMLMTLLLLAVGAGLYFTAAIQHEDPKPAPVTVVAAKPAMVPLSSARLANISTVKTKPVAQDIPFSAAVAKAIGKLDTNQTAFTAFNILAAVWEFPRYKSFKKTALDPWNYLSILSANRSMELIQFNGALDGLVDIDYPAILQIKSPDEGKEIYVALTAVSNNEYILPGGIAGKKKLTKAELESIWSGKAFILWKNYKKIPPQIAAGSKSKEAAFLKRLLVQAGVDVSNGGAFDQKTVEAIKSFQEAKGLKISGQPDPQTLLYLYKYSASTFYHPALK